MTKITPNSSSPLRCKHCCKEIEIFMEGSIKYIHTSGKFHCKKDKDGMWTGLRATPMSKEEIVQKLLAKIQ